MSCLDTKTVSHIGSRPKSPSLSVFIPLPLLSVNNNLEMGLEKKNIGRQNKKKVNMEEAKGNEAEKENTVGDGPGWKVTRSTASSLRLTDFMNY